MSTNITITQTADAIQDAWHCTRRIAILAARYYRGVDAADDLIGPRYMSSNRPHPPLLSAKEFKAIVHSR